MRWSHVALPLILTAVVPCSVAAQQTVPRPAKTVLFVCEHGTVRSLLGKVLFEQYAAEVGLRMHAVSRGARADSAVPAWMEQRLSADGIALGDWRPETLRASDLTNASYIVSFDLPAAAIAGGGAPRAQWNGLPSVSQDYAGGRDAIKVRVRALLDSLKSAEVRKKPRAPAAKRAPHASNERG